MKDGYFWDLYQKLQEVVPGGYITELEDVKWYCVLVNGKMGKLEAIKCDDNDLEYYFICEKGESIKGK